MSDKSQEVKVVFDRVSRSILVGEGKGAVVHSPSAGKAVLNAALYLKNGVFPVVEYGLHLKESREALFAQGVAENIGYIAAHYAGSDPTFLALKPDNGWARLSYAFGIYSAYAFQVRAYEPGETQDTRHWRRAGFLHGAIDALLSGASFTVQPVFPKRGDGENDADEPQQVQGLSMPERQLAFVVRYEEVWNMSPEEAATSYREMVATKVGRNALRQNYLAAEQGKEMPVIESLPLHGGGEWKVEDMIGKKVLHWWENICLGGFTLVTEENAAPHADTCQQRGWQVSEYVPTEGLIN